MQLLSLCLMVVSFCLPCVVNAQTVLAIDPRGTYLRTFQDSPRPPLIINLGTLNLGWGDYLRLEVLGACQPGSQFQDNRYTTMGVFSSSNTLLETDQPHRVPGAIISCGTQVISANTHFGGLPTDIPQDFLIASHGTGQRETTVRIPTGATYLFVCFHDSLYRDNTDPNGDYRFRISRADSGGDVACDGCVGDVNCDGCVDDADLLMVLFAFGSDDPDADLNDDGIVDDADLLFVLFGFGSGC